MEAARRHRTNPSGIIPKKEKDRKRQACPKSKKHLRASYATWKRQTSNCLLHARVKKAKERKSTEEEIRKQTSKARQKWAAEKSDVNSKSAVISWRTLILREGRTVLPVCYLFILITALVFFATTATVGCKCRLLFSYLKPAPRQTSTTASVSLVFFFSALLDCPLFLCLSFTFPIFPHAVSFRRS